MKKICRKNTSFYTNKPFTIFEIDDFLPKEKYSKIIKNFPNCKLFEGGDGINPVSINVNDNKLEEFLNENQEWKDFVLDIQSEKFINSLFRFSLIEMIKIRGIKSLRIWTKKNKHKLIKKIFRKIEIQNYFSMHKNNELICPHTDARTKLISLIYYVPDDNYNFSQGGGTEFWKIKKNIHQWRNWDNKHIINNTEIEELPDNFKSFF